uniref:SH3 domain-containing protein n=1 Tax=Ganoderma boninense TaxID=34458 RepID=A0A5K1K6J5_9APHY|nr:SH3 domain-containing protein [Ganoderma boninense]
MPPRDRCELAVGVADALSARGGASRPDACPKVASRPCAPGRHASSLFRDVLNEPLTMFVTLQMPKETTKHTKRKAAEKAEKAPKAKGKKDPKAPKRPPCPHTCSSARTGARGSKLRTPTPVSVSLQSSASVATVTEANDTRLTGEIGKLLGAKWKELDEEEKKPYLDQAAADKARAEQEKNEYDGKKGDSAGSGDGDDDDE